MRRRLTSAITMGVSLAAGCERRVGDEFVVPVAGSSTTLGGDTSSTSTTTDDDSGADDERPVFDIGPLPDTPFIPPGCDPIEEPPPVLGSSCEVLVDEYPDVVTVCQPADTEGECISADTREIVELLEACHAPVGDLCAWIHSSCGPVLDTDGNCCYWGSFGGQCPGRPFIVDGVARLADTVSSEDWCTPWRSTSPTELDEKLAEAWRFDGRHEHAAIASFSRFALELLAMAAPARFVDAALRAAADEQEHAMLFFGLAHAYSDRALGPGRLAVEGALRDAHDATRVVVATVREGCIAETISAMQLSRASTTATHVELRDALARIVAQEVAHVELAWAFVAWAYARGDARLRAAVDDAFANAWHWIPVGADVDPAPGDEERWRAHGRLTRADAKAIADRTLNTIVLPMARELRSRVQPLDLYGAAYSSDS